MRNTTKIPAIVRYPGALCLAVLTENLLLVIAEDVGFLSLTRDDISRFPSTLMYLIERIALCALLVLPSLYAIDWLVESRWKSILISFIAVIIVAWAWAS